MTVFQRYQDWLTTLDKPYLFVTCGDWDLRQCLPNQARASKLHIPAGFKTWRNIKREFGSFYGTPQPRGMLDMLGTLRLQLEGRHHSGLDDCKNIARVLMKMIEDGYRTSLE
eukprot:comp19742_c0_seq1/m.38032 comp19742_c0_seq1/g.38032  ORF comp19742_c0_seq1/g.38032 comp19742_c0_seq1/m.38032 type:complete len:112 (+) comp19742_c0_seq1:434-769(+)